MKPINDTFLRALKREHTDYTPLWLMRQAGRYLPEYNATRARLGSFLALAKCPEAACEVTLQPVDRFGLDAAILFSDILTVPDAMGLGLSFVAGEGPVFAKPVQSEEAVNALFVPDIEETLGYVTEAVRVIRRELADRVPLIGFSGSPTMVKKAFRHSSDRNVTLYENLHPTEAVSLIIDEINKCRNKNDI